MDAWVLNLFQSNVLERWKFKDGVSVHEVLESVDLEKIRSACSQQSRTQWTAIASRDRLYQFMSMSDEETQTEMRQNLSATGFFGGSGCPSTIAGSSSYSSTKPQGVKR